MWHTCAYQGSITNSLTNTNLPGAADNVFRIGPQNGFVLQEDMMLLTALAVPTNGTGFRLNAPKFAQFGPIQVTPLLASTANSNGLLVATWPYRSPTFRNQEEVFATVDTGGAAPGQETLVTCFANSIDPIPNGEELTLKITSTTAAVANAWTLVTYAFTQTLPEGLYALIGSELQSTNGIAHRWTFWGQFYRPGFPSITAFNVPQWPGMRDYRMGLAGKFSNVTPPQLEVFASAANAAHTGIIRAIKIA